MGTDKKAAERSVQCCRCKHVHPLSERTWKRTRDGWKSSRCPRCLGESYFELDQKLPPI